MNRIIFFSGGKGSFKVAAHLKENYSNDNIVLYFTDTLWEHQDLWRFMFEVSDKLQLPLLIQSIGLNPIQLMAKKKILFNSRFGTCSIELKMKTAMRYFKKGIEPPIHLWHNKQYLKDETKRQAIQVDRFKQDNKIQAMRPVFNRRVRLLYGI